MARLGAAIGIALFWLTILAGGSFAVETGTHGWITRAATLYGGPGTEYDVVGDVEENIEIRIERCDSNWCRIRAGGLRGWTTVAAISFGQLPLRPLQGPKFDFRSGDGTVCLYTGEDYTGAELCRDSGVVLRDLMLYNVDDTYSSVRIEGEASVLLCRDRFFQSYCENVTESQRVLQGFLNNNVSSIHVY